MPNKTANYNLTKPLESDYYDINVSNENMDIIDREIKKVTEYSNKRIDHLEANLQDNELSSFKTDALMTKLEGCNGGFIQLGTNGKSAIQGKTLVNILEPRYLYATQESVSAICTKTYTANSLEIKMLADDTFNVWRYIFLGKTLSRKLKPNTNYTLIFDATTTQEFGMSIVIQTGGGQYQLSPSVKATISNGTQAILLTTNDLKNIIDKEEQCIYISIPALKKDTTFKISNVMLIEGDLTNNPPNFYFEGMKSVGEVACVNGKYSGKNLINDKNKYRLYVNGGTSTNSIVLSQDSSSLVLENPPVNVDLTFTNHIGDRVLVATFDSLAANSRPIEILAKDSKISTFKITKQARYLIAYLDSAGRDVKAQLEFGTLSTEYEEYYEGCKIEFVGKGKNLLDTSIFKPDIYVTNFKNDENTITYSCITNHHGTQNISLSYLAGKEVTISALAKRARFVVSNCYYKGKFYDIMDTTTASDDNEVLISRTFTLTQQSTISINCSTFPGNSSIKNIMMVLGNEVKEYIPYQENKKEIQSATPWRKWDFTDVNGGKTIGSGEVVLNGGLNENWTADRLNPLTSRFKLNGLDKKIGMSNLLSMLKVTSSVWTDADEVEGICGNTVDGGIYIRILNSKTGITDKDSSEVRIQKLRTYLAANNIPVCYELGDSAKAYENSNKTLNLKSCDYLNINSGAIQPQVTYSYAKTSGERITSIENRIGDLDIGVINKNINDVDIKIGETSNLQTKDKTNLVASINELFQSASNSQKSVNDGKNLIAGVVGNVTGQNSFQEIAGYVENKRNEIGKYLGAGDYPNLQRVCDWTWQRKIDITNQLVAKGIEANGSAEDLGQLINKIEKISNRIKYAEGTYLSLNNPQTKTFSGKYTVSNLDFKPKIILTTVGGLNTDEFDAYRLLTFTFFNDNGEKVYEMQGQDFQLGTKIKIRYLARIDKIMENGFEVYMNIQSDSYFREFVNRKFKYYVFG